jgi:hypothetical protein
MKKSVFTVCVFVTCILMSVCYSCKKKTDANVANGTAGSEIQNVEKLSVAINGLKGRAVNMLFVPAGSYRRLLAEGKTKEIKLKPFFISDTEVTFGYLRQYVSETAAKDALQDERRILSQFGAEGKITSENFTIPDDWPAMYVSFFEACRFCNWLSEKEHLEPVYTFNESKDGDANAAEVVWDSTKNGYRLPTEAEWEYCASYDGQRTDTSKIQSEAVLRIGTTASPANVASKAANSLAMFDLIGNVYEWCWDLYNEEYYAGGESENPLGPASGFNQKPFDPQQQGLPPSTTDRVIKGYDFFTKAEEVVSVMHRNFSNPAATVNPVREIAIGFRLVRNAK